MRDRQKRTRSRQTAGACGILAFVFAQAATVAASDNWRQWGGPQRNFVANDVDLALWPDGGPKRLWERELGDGFSSIIVDEKSLYTQLRRGDDEVVIALDADTGETQWEFSYPAPLPEGLDRGYGIGPRSTPLLIGKRLFTVGITGILHCVDTQTHASVWSHDLVGTHGGNIPRWGYASSPLAYREIIIVPVGGSDGKGVMAFRQKDGEIVWQEGEEKNSYSSPIIIDLDGKDQCVLFMVDEVIGLDPATGKREWSFPHKTSYNINASTPVWSDDNLLLISSAYGTGSRALRLRRDEGAKAQVEEAWSQRRIGVHHATPIRVGDTIFCSVGMMGPAILVALDAKTGEILWRNREFSKATLVNVGAKFVILGEDGTLGLATMTREAVEIHAKVDLLGNQAWTAPTIVGTRLYVRDRKKALALELPGGMANVE